MDIDEEVERADREAKALAIRQVKEKIQEVIDRGDRLIKAIEADNDLGEYSLAYNSFHSLFR